MSDEMKNKDAIIKDKTSDRTSADGCRKQTGHT